MTKQLFSEPESEESCGDMLLATPLIEFMLEEPGDDYEKENGRNTAG